MSLAHTKYSKRNLQMSHQNPQIFFSYFSFAPSSVRLQVREALNLILNGNCQYLGIWCVETHDSNIPLDITADVGPVCKQTQGRAQLLLQAFGGKNGFIEKLYTYHGGHWRWRCYGRHNLRKRCHRC